MEQLKVQTNVKFRAGFLGESDMNSLAAESGILVLPNLDRYVEVSGVVHDFAGYGMAVLCSDTPRFAELRDGFDCLKVKPTPSNLGDSLCKMLGDLELRERLARNLSRLAKNESWGVRGRDASSDLRSTREISLEILGVDFLLPIGISLLVSLSRRDIRDHGNEIDESSLASEKSNRPRNTSYNSSCLRRSSRHCNFRSVSGVRDRLNLIAAILFTSYD